MGEPHDPQPTPGQPASDPSVTDADTRTPEPAENADTDSAGTDDAATDSTGTDKTATDSTDTEDAATGGDDANTDDTSTDDAAPVADHPAWYHRLPALGLPAGHTRWALLAVAIGAIAAAVVTITVTGGFGKDRKLETRSPDDPATTGAVAGEAFGTATHGDCLTWTKADASDLSKVNCTDPHLFEVAQEVDLSNYLGAEFGPDAKFPGVLRFAELKQQHCVPAVQRYLNSKFDPNGKFSVGLINPGEAGWAAGERTLRCGLQYSGNSGILRPIVGPVAGQDQSDVLENGTCVGINQNLPADPVDCTKPHAFEVVATIDLTKQFPGAAPSVADQDRFLEPECTKASTDYLGSPDALRNKTLTLFWGQFDQISWLAGSRKINCSVGKGADKEGFAPITNSAKGDILINGQPPVPPPAIPDGRSVPAPLPGAAPAPVPAPAPPG
ncbi:septum formation family protein [Skermania piniformis]|uniref:Septum formation family protein n=1 Tax=Skermania pinensis TaxID=39122 RepID=A0ABX8S9N8_9ACTN|nr:septum formation family protein [Skermania piniformis]QXQ14016.1 septum formation family protein [Skermania piniformis]